MSAYCKVINLLYLLINLQDLNAYYVKVSWLLQRQYALLRRNVIRQSRMLKLIIKVTDFKLINGLNYLIFAINHQGFHCKVDCYNYYSTFGEIQALHNLLRGCSFLHYTGLQFENKLKTYIQDINLTGPVLMTAFSYSVE